MMGGCGLLLGWLLMLLMVIYIKVDDGTCMTLCACFAGGGCGERLQDD